MNFGSRFAVLGSAVRETKPNAEPNSESEHDLRSENIEA
jgi:hypothetical protein